MRTGFIVSVVLACAGIPAIGQQPSGMLAMSGSDRTSLDLHVGSGCPLNVQVRTSSVLNILEASKGRHTRRIQKIEMGLLNHGTKDVTSFDAHVIGFPRHPSFQYLTEQYPTAAPSVSVSIHVVETVVAGGSLSIVRTVQNIIGVKWLQLDTISFRDGSTWERSSTTDCRVQPDPFLLVAEH